MKLVPFPKIAPIPTRIVPILAVALGITGLLYVVDAATIGAQKPAECPRTSVAVDVPRTHVWPINHLTSDHGPSLRDVIADDAPDVSLTQVIAANTPLHLAPKSDLPAIAGGKLCLTVPGVKTSPVASKTDKVDADAVAPTSLHLTHSFTKLALGAAYKQRGKDTITDHDIAHVAYQAGFRDNALVNAIAVSLGESNGKVHARNYNNGRSTDCGLWQINDRAHPEVGCAAADNPTLAARAAYRISHHGNNFGPWFAWVNRHLNHNWANITARAIIAAHTV